MKSVSKKKTKKPPRRLSGSLTEAAAQRLGFACKDLAEADAASGIQPNLAKYFERHPRLRKAYDRGRLLKYLVELAPVTVVPQAARRLKDLGFVQFDSGQALRDFLDRDKEANDLWESSRVNAEIENRQNMRKTAAEGNVRAIQFMDKWAVDRQRETGEAAGVSFARVGVNQMSELFAVSRQTIYEWYSSKGLPQNGDGTFDLARALPWFEEFTLKKAVKGRSETIGPLNPFQAVKTERERLRLEQDRGDLIERGTVLAWQIALMQNIVNAFNAIADLANRVFGQPREEIVERLEDFRDEVMGKLQHVPAELKLSPPAIAKLAELYEMLKPPIDRESLATEDTEEATADERG